MNTAHHDKPVDEGPRHNMLVAGQKEIFLSHLPMFMAPHNVQLILEATFTNSHSGLDEIYFKDRQSHSGTKIYTLKPEVLIIESLFTPGSHNAARHAFAGTAFRGHLERGGKAIDTLTNMHVNVKSVVYSQVFGPGVSKSDHLEYILFGKAPEFYLAHVIAAPPDFDQVIAVKIDNPPTPDELISGVRVSFLDRANSASKRIKEGEKLEGQGHAAGAHQFLSLNIQAGVEFYLEEGELAKQM
jgi:hypothetical protein